MEKTKEMFAEMQEQMAEIAIQYDNGDLEVLDALTYLEQYKAPLTECLELIKGFKDQNQSAIGDSAADYKDGYRGYQIEVRNGGKMYNFKKIEAWQEAEANKKKVELKYKTMLAARLAGNPLANISEDGEELTLPEITYRKDSVVMKKLK